jgi:hypothetical protein
VCAAAAGPVAAGPVSFFLYHHRQTVQKLVKGPYSKALNNEYCSFLKYLPVKTSQTFTESPVLILFDTKFVVPSIGNSFIYEILALQL